MLTSSAVLRPLHEANAHSGLAVAACMRSTGGPIKRRQEQEMERETGSARPQGPRRYHHCPPLCVRSGACLQTTSDPLPPFLPLLTWCVSSARAVLKPASGLLCVCPLGAGCPTKTPQNPHVCVSSSGCTKSQNPCFSFFFVNPPSTALSHPAVCVFRVSECACVLKHTHSTIRGHFVFLSVFVCLLQCSKKKKKLALLGSVLPSRVKKERDGVALCLSVRASLLPFIVVLLFVAVCCRGFPLLFVCR